MARKLTCRQPVAANRDEDLSGEKTTKRSLVPSEAHNKLVTGVDISQLTPKEKAARITLAREVVTGVKLLPADDISSLSPEERTARIERARKAVFDHQLKERRSLMDANPSALDKMH